MPQSGLFDVIVVGGGHAGTEAAAAAARMGARTAMVTQSLDRVGELSCNPSIGGVGKGHLVREIDSLDGLMARAADAAGIHFKLLNRSKGPAVRGLRAQEDRQSYKREIQALLKSTAGVHLLQGEVADLLTDRSGAVSGVLLASGVEMHAGAVVVTTGTFLRGVIHVGHLQTPAGRVGEAPSVALAHSWIAARWIGPRCRLIGETRSRSCSASCPHLLHSRKSTAGSRTRLPPRTTSFAAT